MLNSLALAALLAGAPCGCRHGEPAPEPELGGATMTLQVTSDAFTNEGAIPSKYTCDGDDVVPPLSWTGAPPETTSYALIMDDPDAPAGTWVHWVAWNIRETSIAEASLPAGIAEGTNSWKRTGYGGPCPPSGSHRYYFKVYALDTEIELDASATKDRLLRAMEGHVLAQGQLMGRYQRKR